MSDVPLWIQTLQALATPVIGATVGVVAFMQWRTAHQKVVLDLFERRYKVYEQVRDAVGSIMRSGHTDGESELAMMQAIEASRFFFGKDVETYLRTLYDNALKLELANKKLNSSPDENTAACRSQLFKSVTAFYERAPEIFGRYMRMDQKLVPTPAEWFAARNPSSLGLRRRKAKVTDDH